MDLENSKSFRGEIMKKQLHIFSGKSLNNEQIPAIIDHLWNVCGQIEVEALLTCGSRIIGVNAFICGRKTSGLIS